MRYYSDELKQFFDTEESLLAAEETARQKQESAKATKAKYAKAIEEADKAVDDAYEALKNAKIEVEKLQKEYDEKVHSIMNPVREHLKLMQKERADAIRAFNEKYGVYTTTYTGNKALNEFMKLNDFCNNFFDRRFFF